MNEQDYAALARRVRPAFLALMAAEKLEPALEDSLCRAYLPLADWVRRQKRPGQPLLLGVNGAQGSGKSTLCAFLALILREAYGYKVAGFSLDDLYKTRAERERMAREIHPLFATRGVPGSHDVALGLDLLAALLAPAGGAVALPCFDKATDDRRPPAQWRKFQGPADVVVFEGWCVGSRPQAEAELAAPVNALERLEDPQGVWRREVNRQLQGPYAALFARLDRLIFIQVPGMDCVARWRGLQEEKLAAATPLAEPAALRRFIMHYERLTRHNLQDLPGRADLTLRLDENHRFTPFIEPVIEPDMAIRSFHPPVRTLMGPGPSDVPPRVLQAMARPTIGHLDPLFVAMMDEVKALLQYAFKTKNALTLPVSAPGSAGMETVFVNLVEPGDTVIVCQNGVFGGRMRENVERAGAKAVMALDDWGQPVDPQKVEDALKANPGAKIVAFVQAETSTGACSDAKTLAALAHAHGALAVVDAVTSLGGSPLDVDGWGIDAVYSGSQKCLSCTPGLSPVSFGEAAVERIKNRKSKVQSWFLDLNLVTGYWGGGAKRAYHHTAPINALYGLHEALIILQQEGLENAWRRHHDLHLALTAGFEAMGLSLIVPEAARLPQLNTVAVPAGVDEARVRATLLNRYQLEIGAGLGTLAGQVWRFGLMGHGASAKNVLFCLAALEAVLADMDAPIRRGAAVAAAQKVITAKGY